ncbi:Chromate resistance protein ChrB [Massilia timonae]|uniref:Chromate resistance protein ChrB n=1 Tax=Massilia timonae TaxID=47229 RepID=UPI0012FA6B44|nr:Chromate resistance protein ChrB [Massilia timonae]
MLTLPSNNATARIRIWRALKALGCVPLRDGAYLLPHTVQLEHQLRTLADECLRESGSAWLLVVQPQSEVDSAAYRSLFDRSADYCQQRL